MTPGSRAGFRVSAIDARYDGGRAPVAQWTERGRPKACVGGSSPSGGASSIETRRTATARWQNRGMTTEHPNSAIYRRTADAFRAGDFAALGSLLDDDVVWHVPGSGPRSGDQRGT